MPICDGLEATRRIRAHEREKGLQPAFIIALTAHASKKDEEECYGAGLDEFLTKPVSVASISAVMNKYLLRKAAADEAKPQ